MKNKLVICLTIFLIKLVYAGGDSECIKLIKQESYAQARELCQPLAESGNKDAQLAVGVLYANGYAVTLDYPIAIKWLTLSANQGQATAAYDLGNLYVNGTIGVNYTLALKWYLLAIPGSKSGYVEYTVALFYLNGMGTSQDYNLARKYFLAAANKNYSPAMTYLGLMYQNGWGVVQSYADALNWYQKAAKLNNPSAMNQLYLLYKDGLGVEKNESQAMGYLMKGVNGGSAFAMLNLAWNYAYGGMGLPKDKDKAILYARRALSSDDNDGLYPDAERLAKKILKDMGATR